MSIEIDYLANKYNYERNIVSNEKNSVAYELNAEVIDILFPDVENGLQSYHIVLGEKYNGLVTLEACFAKKCDSVYNSFYPDLPQWPFSLQIEIMKNGTFRVLEKGATKPFLSYDNKNLNRTTHFAMKTRNDKAGLVAFYDCTENQPFCGTFYERKIYGCRERYVTRGKTRRYSHMVDLTNYQKNYSENIIFDEFLVLEPVKGSLDVQFTNLKSTSIPPIRMSFKENAIKIKATYKRKSDKKLIVKVVESEKWYEHPAKPYIVQVIITKVDIQIFGERNGKWVKFVTFNLCTFYEDFKIKFMYATSENGHDAMLHFDCIRNATADSYNHHIGQSRKSFESPNDPSFNVSFHREGLNFSFPCLYTEEFHNDIKPQFLFHYDMGMSVEDWCEGNSNPEFYTNDNNVAATTKRKEQNKKSESPIIAKNMPINANFNVDVDRLIELLKPMINETISQRLKDLSDL